PGRQADGDKEGDEWEAIAEEAVEGELERRRQGDQDRCNTVAQGRCRRGLRHRITVCHVPVYLDVPRFDLNRGRVSSEPWLVIVVCPLASEGQIALAQAPTPSRFASPISATSRRNAAFSICRTRSRVRPTTAMISLRFMGEPSSRPKRIRSIVRS